MPDEAEHLELLVGDSEMNLVDALKDNLLDVYCDRSVIEQIWPPTLEERKGNPKASYSQTKIY